MTRVDRLFTDADRQRIEAAVNNAESRTSGEIVPYIVGRCDDYEEAEWRGAVLLGLAGFVGTVTMRGHTGDWATVDVTLISLVTLGCALMGFALVKFVPFVKRLVAGKHLMHHRLHQRAAEAFIKEEVFATRERTGILLFAGMLERIVLVVGDSGINTKVKEEEWLEIVRLLSADLARGKAADGFVAAIQASGKLLERSGVARAADDKDELRDSLRTSAR
jgi:putative membrane protein